MNLRRVFANHKPDFVGTKLGRYSQVLSKTLGFIRHVHCNDPATFLVILR